MVTVVEIDINKVASRVEVFYIRTQVFIFEQGVDPSLEYDEFDDNAHHYLALENETSVGAARWRYTDEGIKLERFAVLAAFRNCGVGAAILKKVMEDVRPLSKKIYLHAQIKAVPFYERYGFVKEGDEFTEAGMKHFAMVWKDQTGF
ncbi:MAG: GNAT family N-acetyltransferase [Bacteroidota bacterium]